VVGVGPGVVGASIALAARKIGPEVIFIPGRMYLSITTLPRDIHMHHINYTTM